MLPTPDLSNLTSKDYEHVYEPAEDTFILLDALEADAQDLKNDHPGVCLEIGSGSGCVTCFIARILGSSVRASINSFRGQQNETVLQVYLCTDINPYACLCSLSTGVQNKVSLEPINSSLAFPFHFRLKHSVDVIIFNPPYVPTLVDEARDAQDTRDIEGSWAGGTNGMDITDRFLDLVEELMAPRARFYLVAVKQNDIPGIRRRMLEFHSLQSKIVLHRRAGREHLFVIRFIRNLH